MADDPPETTEPGPGPGRGVVPAQMIVALAFYLVVITSLLLWGIYRRWPNCDAVCVSQAAASASPSPSPTAATPSPTIQPSPTPSPTATPTPTPPPTSLPTQPTTTPTPTIAIESISPKTGLMDCNIQVTITGKGFKQGASVTFGGFAAAVIAVDPDGESLHVKPPAHAEGDVDVVVNNPDGASSNIAKAAYTYACPPTSETDLFCWWSSRVRSVVRCTVCDRCTGTQGIAIC